MKYYRLKETDHEEENSQSHIFIKVPETESEIEKFNALKNLIILLKDLDLEEEFADDFGDMDDESHSYFELIKSNGEPLLFEKSIVDILLKENKYSENKYYIATLSETILDFKDEDLIEALASLENRSAFKSFTIHQK